MHQVWVSADGKAAARKKLNQVQGLEPSVDLDLGMRNFVKHL